MSNSTSGIEGGRKSYNQINDTSSATKVTVIPYRRSKEHSSALPPSPADSLLVEPYLLDGAMDAMTAEEDRLTRPINRGTPGDIGMFSVEKTAEQKELARRKSQFYGDAFAWREPNGSARERVQRESVIMADIRTNVIVQDEYTFITDLSNNLSSRYQRPESSILVSVAHSACLLFGGSFEPAYILTITALPSQVQTTTNKRNASLLQKILEDSLGVPASRGVVKFVAIAEENFACNGQTVASEIEELEKDSADYNSNLKRSALRHTKSSKSRNSIRSSKPGNKEKMPLSPMSDRFGSISPPLSFSESAISPRLPDNASGKSSIDKQVNGGVRKLGKRKSFIHSLFSR